MAARAGDERAAGGRHVAERAQVQAAARAGRGGRRVGVGDADADVVRESPLRLGRAPLALGPAVLLDAGAPGAVFEIFCRAGPTRSGPGLLEESLRGRA